MLTSPINFPKQMDSAVVGRIIVWMREIPFPKFKPP
jgi:hypothetical protein